MCSELSSNNIFAENQAISGKLKTKFALSQNNKTKNMTIKNQEFMQKNLDSSANYSINTCETKKEICLRDYKLCVLFRRIVIFKYSQ